MASLTTATDNRESWSLNARISRPPSKPRIRFTKADKKIGLTGKMVHALPGILLATRLDNLAASLGPLPHARLNIERGADDRGPADREKKQRNRHLKAECEAEGCGFIVRVAAKQVKDIGPPHCPKHGAMSVDLPEE